MSSHEPSRGKRDRKKTPAVIRSRPPGLGSPDPSRGFDRTAGLFHELCNLLDGSMRQVNLALRSLDDATEHRAEQGDLDRRLRVVKGALEQMAGMLAAATRPTDEGSGPDRLGATSLAEAVRHATSILEPEAAENSVKFNVQIDPRLEEVPARSAYSVVLNALRNALDSIKSKGGPGTVHLSAALVKGPWSMEAVIEVSDNGQGLRSAETGILAFEPGYTTKKGRHGLGLALCREIMRELGGEASLRPGEGGLGAVFMARWPAGEGREPSR